MPVEAVMAHPLFKTLPDGTLVWALNETPVSPSDRRYFGQEHDPAQVPEPPPTADLVLDPWYGRGVLTAWPEMKPARRPRSCPQPSEEATLRALDSLYDAVEFDSDEPPSILHP